MGALADGEGRRGRHRRAGLRGAVPGVGRRVGQRIQKQIGQTGVPVYNVANGVRHRGHRHPHRDHGHQAPARPRSGWPSGAEQMGKMGLLGGGATKKEKKVFEPSGRYGAVTGVDGRLGTETMPGVFAQAGTAYAHDHDGVGFEQFARVAYKNHLHSTLNPLAQYQKEFSMDEIMASPMMSYPNTLLMCCPTGDGAASLVLVSGERLASMPAHVRKRAVKVSASVLTSDPFTEDCQVQPDVNTLTRNAADQAYEAAGVGPEDLDLVELHDCFATAELIHYDNLGTVRARRRRRLHRLGRTVPGRQRRRSTSPAGSSPRATPSAPPAWPTSTRSPPISGAKPATARSKAPPSAWPTSSAWPQPAESTS